MSSLRFSAAKKNGFVSNNKQINSLFGSSAAPKRKSPTASSTKKTTKPEDDFVPPPAKRFKRLEPVIHLTDLPFELLEEIFKLLWLEEIDCCRLVSRFFRQVCSDPRVRWSRIAVSSPNVRKIYRAIVRSDPPANLNVQELLIHLNAPTAFLPMIKYELRLLKKLSRLRALKIQSDMEQTLHSIFLKELNGFSSFQYLEEFRLSTCRSPIQRILPFQENPDSKSCLGTFVDVFLTSLRTLELPTLVGKETDVFSLLSTATQLEYLKANVYGHQGHSGDSLVSLDKLCKLTKLDLCFVDSDWSDTIKSLPGTSSSRLKMQRLKICLLGRTDLNSIWSPQTLFCKLWNLNMRTQGFSMEHFAFLDHLDTSSLIETQLPCPQPAIVESMIRKLAEFDQLRELKLDAWNLTNGLGALNLLARLESLVLECVALDSKTFKELHLPKLRNLSLLSATGVLADCFAAFDSRFPSIQSLSLYDTTIFDIGPIVLPSLRRAKGLVHLNLAATSLDASFVSPFITSIGRRLKSFILAPNGPELTDLDLDTFGHFCLDLTDLAICLSDNVLPQHNMTLKKRCKSLQRFAIATKMPINQQSLAAMRAVGITLLD